MGIEQTLDQLRTSVGAIEGIDTMMAESQQATEERLMLHMDDRLTAIAKLIRSDNQVLAGKVETAVASPGPAAGTGGLSSADSESLRQTLRAVKELLVLTRVQLVLARAEELSLDCPFWLEPDPVFRGRQVSEHRFLISLGGGGKGHIVSQGTRQDLGFGGAGRVLFGRMFEDGDGLFIGAELGASGSFPRDEMGQRTTLQIGADLVTPVVYRYVVTTNTHLEFEAGWLGRSTEDDWSDVDHGVHFGFAIGGRALRARFLFPGAALGLSWERTFVDGDDRIVIKFGIRGGFDIEL